jgi:hypothetical protein
MASAQRGQGTVQPPAATHAAGSNSSSDGSGATDSGRDSQGSSTGSGGIDHNDELPAQEVEQQPDHEPAAADADSAGPYTPPAEQQQQQQQQDQQGQAIAADKGAGGSIAVHKTGTASRSYYSTYAVLLLGFVLGGLMAAILVQLAHVLRRRRWSASGAAADGSSAGGPVVSSSRSHRSSGLQLLLGQINASTSYQSVRAADPDVETELTPLAPRSVMVVPVEG